MKRNKILHRLLAWMLVLAMVLSSGLNVRAAESEQLRGELLTESDEETEQDTRKQEEVLTEKQTEGITERESAAVTESQTESETAPPQGTETAADQSETITEAETAAENERKQPRTGTTYQLEDWLSGTLEIWVAQLDQDGNPTGNFTRVDPDHYLFTKGETIKIYLSYEVPEGIKGILSAADILEYQLPDYFGTIKPVTDGRIKDNAYTEGDAGSYTVDAAGRVEIKFDQKYLNTGKIKGGEFSFEGTLDVQLDENGGSKLTFGDAEVNIKVDTTAKLEIEKEAERTVTKIDDDSVIKYTLKVTAPELNPTTVTGAVVKDKFRTDCVPFLKDYSFDGYTGSSGLWSDGAGNQITVSGKSFEWALAPMAPGEVRTLTYTVKVDQSIWQEDSKKGLVSHNVINDVIVTVDGKKTGEDKADILFYKQHIRKALSHGDVNGNLVYIVSVNWEAPLADMHGKTVTDILTAGTLTEDVTVKRYVVGADGKMVQDISWLDTITGVAGGTSFNYTFDKGSDPDCRYGYTFTYKVTPENEHVHNKADVDGYHGAEVEYYGLGVKKNFEQYQRDADGKLWIDWTVTATTPLQEGFQLRDTMYSHSSNTHHSNINGHHQNIVMDSAVLYDKNGNKLEEGVDYDITYSTYASSGKCYTVNAVFKRYFDAGVTMKVQTCLDLDSLQEYLKSVGKTLNDGIIIRNESAMFSPEKENVTSRLVTAYDEFEYFEAYSLDKDLPDSFYNEADRTITWELTVNPNGAMEGTVYILEELPEGLEFVSAEIIPEKTGALYDGTINPKPTLIADAVAGSEGRTVELTVKDIVRTNPAGSQDGQVAIKFISRITDEDFGMKTGTFTFTNKATIVNNFTDKEVLRSVTRDAEITQESLAKASVVEGSKVTYTIDVNKDRKQLIPASPEPDMQEVFFIDKWSENLSINRASIKVYRIETNGFETLLTLDSDYQLEVDNIQRQFKMYLEDQTYYQIKYEAVVSGAIGEDVTIKNDVALFGKADYSAGEEKEFTIQKSDASSSINPGITINKYVQGTSEVLPGAGFTLAPVIVENGAVKWEDPVNKIPAMGSQVVRATDSSGKAVFSPLEWDTLYVYWESGRPAGYEEATPAKYHYVYLTQKALPAYITQLQAAGEDVRVNQESLNQDVENIRIPGELTVKKVSASETDQSGEALPLDNAEFVLYKKAGSVNQYYAVDNGAVIWTADIDQAKKFTTSGGGTVTIRGLDWGTYYVREVTAPEGYIKDDSEQTVTIDADYVSAAAPVVLTYQNEKLEVKADFKVSKKLTGRAMAAGEFAFTAVLISGSAAKVEGLTAGTLTADNTAAGVVEFAELTYLAADRYIYEISETAGNAGGVDYDTASYYVLVAVTADSDGRLGAEVSYYAEYDSAGKTLSQEITDGVQFTNSYESSGEIIFGATKGITGREYHPADQFTFELYDITGGTEALLESRTISPDSGSSYAFSFDKISYTLEDDGKSYSYKIVEKQENSGGITCDTTEYTGTYRISDDGSGNMTAVRESGFDLEDQSSIIFTNTYGSTGKLTLTAVKKWAAGVGLKMQDGQFIFEVREDDNIVATATNNAAGKITFTDIAYGLADVGEHTYKITEKMTGQTGIFYDQTVYEVKVQVSDNKDGTLKAQIISVNGKDQPINFINDTTKAEILKTDEAGVPVANAGLALYDADGNLIESWISGSKAHTLEAKLTAGAVYTLRETEAPQGYLLAPDVTFTAGSDGKVIRVTMIDQKKSDEYSVRITKYVKFQGQYRAMDYSFYAALFWDPECTQRASEVVELKLDKNYCTTAEIKGLAPGTYYVAETNQDGSLLDVTSETALVTNEISNQVITLTPQAATAATDIVNHLRTPDANLYEGSIYIDKQVRAGSKSKSVTDTFYFTLYSDAQMHNIIATKELALKKQSGGIVEFDHLPFGTYYLAETDADGTPVDEAYKYAVTVEQEQVTLQEGSEVVTVKVINDIGEEDEEESEDESEETETNKKDGSKQTTVRTTTLTRAGSVSTGDGTEIRLYLLILLGAGIVICGTIWGRRRSKKR